MGFAHVGKNVSLSTRASLYGISSISIGDNSRIDDFCVLSAGEDGIFIGNYVHVSVFASLIGRGRIELMDFSAVSSRVSVLSSTDDFSGEFMTGPTVPVEYVGVISAPVIVGRHCVVGAGSVLLPGTIMHEGATLGALSLAKGELDSFTLFGGVPARAIKRRKDRLLDLERRFLSTL